MGKDAKVRAATRRARARVIFERIATGAEPEATPANMRAMLPEIEWRSGGFRYRTAKRLLGRALGVERKQAGPILVGRADARAVAITREPGGV